jgi:predicted ATPase/class 3 adenylate cyclase/pSer/pThr/pTyr-binding forkhead associated (FHA) protein
VREAIMSQDWANLGSGVPTAVRAQLRWVDPAGNTQCLPLDRRVTIGRSRDNDVPLPDDTEASRHHAAIVPNGSGECQLTDLDSTNGTFVNEEQIVARHPLTLHPGDRVRVGRTTFTLELPDVLSASSSRVGAMVLQADGTTTVNLTASLAGWLELPNKERRILGAETRIGRLDPQKDHSTPKNDLAFPEDTQMSRKHALIRRIDQKYLLSDSGSTNGVRVNGEQLLGPRNLQAGDLIEVGSTQLRFVLAPLQEQESSGGFTIIGGASPSDTWFFGGGSNTGELREATILFADMKGFTPLSERLKSPEKVFHLMNEVWEAVIPEIVKYGGTIVKYAGDNVMVAFGAPVAHEDDPERAIKAALEMRAALERFNIERLRRRDILQLRTGINTGEVTYGEVGGIGHKLLDVMGDPVNLASRLEHISKPGSITVGETTYHRARRSFVFTTLDPMPIKGVQGLVQAYEVVRERHVGEIVEEGSSADYLIGREPELAQLRAVVNDVRSGHGRLLAVVGEEGIGKTQLVAAFRRSDEAAGLQWVVARCISFESTAEATASYALLGSVIRSLLGLASEDSLDRPKLANVIAAALPQVAERTRAEYLALAGQVMGVKVSGSAIAGLEAKLKRKLLMEMLKALVTGKLFPEGPNQNLATARPLVMALEETQWSDPASVEALDELVDAIPHLPVLVLMTYRPEWTHSWNSRSFYRQITLAELTPEQSRRFLGNLLGGAQLPESIADSIIAKYGNNPRLLEEVAKTLRDRKVLVAQEGQWVLTADIALIPATLRQMIMARIDRLSERDRLVLQRAAVVGSPFTYRQLALLTDLDDALSESLGRLKDAEFIIENLLAPEQEYSFKLPILQEVAYTTILGTDRRTLHGQVGEAIERLNGSNADDVLEKLAYHYNRSGNRRKAIEYLLSSGDKARRLFDNRTAIAQYEEALAKLRSGTTQDLGRDSNLAVRLYEALGDTYFATADFSRAQESYEAGLGLRDLPPADQARVWFKLGRVWEARGEGRKALGSYEQGMVILTAAAPRELAALQAAAARVHARLGEYERATALAHAALAVTNAIMLSERERRTQADAHYVLGLTSYAAGRPDEALEHHLRSIGLRQELGDTSGMQESYHELGSIYWSRGQLDRAFEHLVSLTALLRLNTDEAEAARLRRMRERRDEGGNTPLPLLEESVSELAPIERYYRNGLVAAQQIGDGLGVATIGYRVGELLFRQGELQRALVYLRTALAEADRIGARDVIAAASITHGAILVAQGQGAMGLSYLERGVALAEAVGSAAPLVEGQMRLAEARLALGDVEGAMREEQIGFIRATQVGNLLHLGVAHRIMGRIATVRQDWTLADRHFRQAYDYCLGVDAKHELGRVLVDFATMWRSWAASGTPGVDGASMLAQAQQMLQQAAQLFAHLDMQTDLRAARSALSGY